jgi:pyridoxamine 5'-phosphate oxidase
MPAGVASTSEPGAAGLDPIARFHDLFAAARAREANDPTAAALATADSAGQPSVRMVLVKIVDERGFRFFTNFGSRKAHELEENPRAALCFHWPALERQVRVEGAVETLPGEESDAYFASRSRESQLGAWASRQSAPLDSRAALEERVRLVAERFAGRPVPRPPFWGGYLLVPDRIEMWSGGAHRLHDRELYERVDGVWSVERLFP